MPPGRQSAPIGSNWLMLQANHGCCLPSWPTGHPDSCCATAGTERAHLALLADGSPSLVLADADGKKRVALSAGDERGPGLELFDATRKMRATLWLEAGGSPGLMLRGAAGKEEAGMHVLHENGPGLILIDAAGKPRIVRP